MNKILKRVVSAVAAAVVTVTAVAFDLPDKIALAAVIASGSRDGVTWSIDDNGKMTIGVDVSMSGYDVPMPSPYNEKDRLYIDHVDKITSVVIENGISSIGRNAFYNCTALKSVTIPDSVTEIDDDAFNKCSSLETVVMSDNVWRICNRAFADCTKLKNITLPKYLKNIYTAAFKGCTALESISLPKALSSIDPEAFAGCVNLKTVTVETRATAPGIFDSSFPPEVTEFIAPCTTFKQTQDEVWLQYKDKITEEHYGDTYVENDKKATCTQKGYTGDTYCNSCDALLETGTDIPMTAHNTDGTIAHKDASCTQAGVVGGTYCTVCKYGKTDAEKTIPKLSHSWGEAWSNDTYSHWHVCTKCGATDTKTTHKYGMDYESDDTKHWKICTVCGYKSESSHTYSTSYTKDESGHWYACKTCGYKKDFAEHNIVVWEGVEPTCTRFGWTEGLRCSECYYIEKARERIDKTDHTWDSGTITTTATCSSDGEINYTCSACGTTKTEVIAAGHSLTHTAEKAATCTAAGNIEYWSCACCGKNFSDENAATEVTEVTIPAKGHTEATDAAVAATCTTAGKTEGKHCAVCGEVLTAQTAVPAKGHTWIDWTVKTPATETSKGEKTRECTVCHTAESRDIPTLAHTHSLTKHNKVEATCTAAGNIEYWSCAGCGKNFSDENAATEVTEVTIPATGHTEATDTAVAATCTKEGKTEGKHCSVCGAVLTAQTAVPAKGHTWSDWTVKTPATETSKGEETRECTVCHTAESREIPSLNHTHTLIHIDEVPATQTTEGVKEHWHCDGCGKDFFDEEGKREADREELRIGKIETEVQAPVNVPKPEIALSKEELIEATLTAEEMKKVDEGTFIKIILKVEDATNTVPAADKTAVTGEIGKMTNYKLGQYLDVTMLKKIGEQEDKITETNAPIRITFEIPAELRGKSEYSVIRIHGGETTILRDLDGDPDTITIETDKFSIYALTYKERSSSSGSGGSHRPTYPSTSDTSDNTSSDTSDNTPSDISDDTSDDIFDNTPSDTSDGTSGDTSDNTPSDTSDNTPNDTSDDTLSDTSDDTSDNSSDTTARNNESSHIQSENDPPDSNGNPSTGIAVSFIPLVTAVAVLTVVSKRKKK